MLHTSAPWFAVEYAGYWMIQDGPSYTDNDILNEEKCPDASANSKLAAAAPELLEVLESIIEIGKRDMTNPKYDGYFEGAKALIKKVTK